MESAIDQLFGSDVYTVQVRSFLTVEEAEQHVQMLTELGYEAYMVTLRGTGKEAQKRIFKVNIGRYKTHGDAERAASIFAEKEGRDEVIAVRVQKEEPGLL